MQRGWVASMSDFQSSGLKPFKSRSDHFLDFTSQVAPSSRPVIANCFAPGQLGFLNNIMLNLNYLFQFIGLFALNTAKGK